LVWDQQAETLYYLDHTTKMDLVDGETVSIEVYRIGLDELKPEYVMDISRGHWEMPFENLKARGIDLYYLGNRLSFGPNIGDKNFLDNKAGSVGIDEEGYFFFKKSKLLKKRLFLVPTTADVNAGLDQRYQTKDYAIKNIRWAPQGCYVVMEHRFWGILILDPAAQRMGHLIQANGHGYGWYQPLVPENK
jgi:hypothetical protein